MRPVPSAGHRMLPFPATWLLAAALAVACSPQYARAQVGPGEGKEGLVELGRADARLKGHFAPKGFDVKVIAAEPVIVDPTAMAFDDAGNLYVAEWKVADHMFDTDETLKLPEGGTTRIKRRRKATVDVVKRLRDDNGDGVYDRAEVVVDGAEMPSSIFPWKNSLYLTCVGRLERWSDEDGDGRFETKTVIADGFCGFYHHWLSGMTLGADGWFYLTAGDNDNHVVGSDGSRVEVSRCGAIFRGKVDGSDMHLFAMGFRNPYRDVVFNSAFDAFHVDNDNEDGSKFQGVRLINPVEEGDYGWRLAPGAACCQPDFDRGAVSGELPGKLPIIAKTGRGAPAGLLIYNGTAFPSKYRDLCIYPDVFRKLVRAYRVQRRAGGGSYELAETLTLMSADDDWFRPCQTVTGPDGAIYVLDWRSNSGGAGRLWGDQKFGRLYKLTWAGDGETPALPVKPNNWNRVLKGSEAELLAMVAGPDQGEARRALREYLDRGAPDRSDRLFALAKDRSKPLAVRLMGVQGARQVWSDRAEDEMLRLLDDPAPEVRRLAAQALSWEPKERRPALIPPLVAHLTDPEGEALREIALALGRHGWAAPQDAAPALWARLQKLDPAATDPATRDAFIRALERIGDPGVEEVAHAVSSAKSDRDREIAVSVFVAFRTRPAAQRLERLATLENLSATERLALVRMFKDIPLNIPVSVQGLAQWVLKRPGLDAAVKVATLDVCRLAGEQPKELVGKLLEDSDESVRIAALQAAERWGAQGSVEKLAQRATDPNVSLPERIALAMTLRSAGPQAFDSLARAYHAFGGDAGFAPIALRAIVDCDRGKARAIAIEALASPLAELRREAIQALGESADSAGELGKAYLEGKLGRGDLPNVVAALRRHNTPDLAKLLEEVRAKSASGAAKLSAEETKRLVSAGADPWRGLKLYLRDSGSRCFSCHKIESFGGNVGPALTSVGKALSIDKLVEAMLEPSKEIKEGYEAFKVAMKDGRVLTGIKVAQDANSLVLRDANARETRLALGEVEEQAKDSLSLMPLGLLDELAPGDLADLIAFLQSEPAQQTLRQSVRIEHAVAAGPIDEGSEAAILSARAPAKPSSTGRKPLAWTQLDSNSGGLFNLQGQVGPTPSTALLAVTLGSQTRQDASLRYGVLGRSRVYLNGKKVGECPTIESLSLDKALVRLPLEPGKNQLVIAVDRPPGGPAMGTFVIGSAAPLQVEAAGPTESR